MKGCGQATSRLTMADVSKLKIALVQMAVGADKVANLRKAVQAVREASENGANIVALPVSSRCMLLVSRLGPSQKLQCNPCPRQNHLI